MKKNAEQMYFLCGVQEWKVLSSRLDLPKNRLSNYVKTDIQVELVIS